MARVTDRDDHHHRRILTHLTLARRACLTALRDHGPRCSCELCHDAGGLLWSLSLAQGLFEGLCSHDVLEQVRSTVPAPGAGP